MKYYVITVRKSTKTKTLKQCQKVVDTLTYFMNQLKKKDPKADIRYHWEDVENKGTHNIHIHGIIKTPNTMKKPKIAKGYYIHFEPMRSETAWNRYITKNDDTANRILLRVSNSTAGSGPALVGRAEDIPIEFREHTSFMKSLKFVNLFKLKCLYDHEQTLK